jgi:hypothetical protein
VRGLNGYRLESYQHFGSAGTTLATFMDLNNKNKHLQLTPQIDKTMVQVVITAKIPPGETVAIDLTKIPLGAGPDKPIYAEIGLWRGFVFAPDGPQVLPHLENALLWVRTIVEELSAV